MFELTRKYEFHAARKLTLVDIDHPCYQLHGHTFSVVVELSGDIDPSKGWVVDFYDIDRIYKDEIHTLLDHKYLNDIKDENAKSSEYDDSALIKTSNDNDNGNDNDNYWQCYL